MPEAFVFGPFRLLVTRRELMAHGVPVAVGQRAFEILLLLVSRHGGAGDEGRTHDSGLARYRC